MGQRNGTRSGKKLLIAVVLGPLCAAAAELPVRAVPGQSEPVAPIPALLSSQIESLAARILEPYLAVPASVRKAHHSDHSPAPAGPINVFWNPQRSSGPLLSGVTDGTVGDQRSLRPTSKGP